MSIINQTSIQLTCVGCAILLVFYMVFTEIDNIQLNDNEDIAYTSVSDKTQSKDMNATKTRQEGVSATAICTSSERQDYFKARYCPHNTRRRGNKHILVNDKLKVGYCFIPKSASSTLKTLMSLSAPKGTVAKVHKSKGRMHYPSVLKSFGLRLISTNDFRKLRNYTKFVAFRHPFTRLVSAYKDKMCHNGKGNQRFIKGVHNYMNKQHKPRYYTDWRVTFEEFVDYILSGHMNRHWQPVQDMCDMCNIRYDSVLRLETFSHDIPNVLTNVLGLDDSILNDFSKNRKRNHSTVSEVDDSQAVAFSEVLSEFRNISSSKMQALRRLYRDDFKNLGYYFDSESYKASCEISSGSNVCC